MQKRDFFIIKTKKKDFHLLELSTVQENPLSVFFQLQKYLLKVFLICEKFLDFFNKYAKIIMKIFHVAKFVKIFF